MGRSNTLSCTVFLVFIPLSMVAGLETTSPRIDRIDASGDGLGALSMVLAPASVALRDELDISELQLRSLQDLKKSYMKRSMAISRKMILQQDNSKNATEVAMKEKRTALDQIFKSLEELLRPEQFRRLRQLRLHTQHELFSSSRWHGARL